MNLLTAPSSQLDLFLVSNLSKESRIQPPEGEDGYLNQEEPHGVRKFPVQ
jgi:hypothetical protein